MPTFETPEKLVQWFRGFLANANLSKLTLAESVGVTRCYYEGMQWLSRGMPLPGAYNQSGKWFNSQFNPDGQLRVTWNLTTRLTVKAAAATFPEKLEADVLVGDMDSGINTAFATQCMGSALNAAINATGMLRHVRDANYRRCIDGVHGIGLAIDAGDGEPKLRCFTFDPIQLTLDPGVPSRNLRDHDVVVYSDVYTADKARRTFAALRDLPDKGLSTIGQLAAFQVQMSYLSGGRLYSQYRTQSTTPGIRVHQVHVKGDNRYDKMYLIAEKGNADYQVLNFDEPSSPFGGDGLPLTVLHAHRRADSFWSISDVSMMMDDQNRANLLGSMLFRQVQKCAGWQWILDKRMIPSGTTKDRIRNEFTNTVAGVVELDFGKKSNPHVPPQLVTYPSPQPMMWDMLNGVGMEMREKVFRAEANMGMTKSHVPDASFQTAIEEADKVLGQRVIEDAESLSDLCEVLLGTFVASAQAETPVALRTLRLAGFGQDEFTALLTVDPLKPAEKIEIRKSSFRYRSQNEKKAAIDQALATGAIDAVDWRTAYASDLDTPVSNLDKAMVAAAMRSTRKIIAGEEWTPRFYGAHNEIFIRQFMAAQNDPQVESDPAAQDRLARAIAAQMQMSAQEQMLRQPPMSAPGSSTGGQVSEDLLTSGSQGTMTFGDAVQAIGG